MGKDKRGQHEQLQSCHPRGLPVATFCPFYELKHTCPRPRVESCSRIKPPLFFSYPAQAVFLVFTQFATIPAGMRTASLWIILDSISRLQLVSLQDEAGRFSGWILALDAVKRLFLVQGGAADVHRHCSLLHVYCSFPLGTWLLALSPFPSLPLCIYYADTPSLCFPSCFSLSSARRVQLFSVFSLPFFCWSD